MATLTYPADNLGNSGETVTYGYYPQGSLNTLSGTDNYQSSASYDTAGRLLQRDLSNGTLQSSYTYYPWDAQITGGDTLGRLAAVQSGTTLTPASLQDLSYHYDPLGNVTAVVDQLAGPQTHAFSYDALNRLVSAEAAGGQDGLYSESYSYDAATGNLAGKGATSYGYQDAAHAHAVTHLDGTAAYTYDANGNMLQRTVGSDVYTFTYTAENKLATAALNGTPLASYVYDGDGQWVSAAVNGVTTRMLDGRFEYDGSLTIYYNAGGQRITLRKGGVLRYLFNDHLGSTSVTSDAAGNSVAELRYRAFGQTRFALGSTPTSLRFTGQMQAPELGLYDYGARFYDPALGRFIQPDTIIPNPYNPMDWDHYSYVGNNPVNRIDPTGHTYCYAGKCQKGESNPQQQNNSSGATSLLALNTPTPMQMPTMPSFISTLSPLPKWQPMTTPTPGTFWQDDPRKIELNNQSGNTSELNITPEDLSKIGNTLNTIKPWGDGLMGGLEYTEKIHLGPGGTLIGFGVDGVIQYLSDSTQDYNIETRLERASARAVESLIISIPSTLYGNIIAIPSAGVLGQPGAVVGFGVGYITCSNTLSLSAEPYMKNYVFPTFPIFTE